MFPSTPHVAIRAILAQRGHRPSGDPVERRARRGPRRARGQLPRPDRHHAGLRAGPRGQRRRGVRQRAVGRRLGSAARSCRPTRHPSPRLGTSRTRHASSSSARARTSSASTSASSTPTSPPRSTSTRSRRPPSPPRRSTPSRPGSPRRSSTTSAARSRPASATTSAPSTRRSSSTSRRWSGPRRDPRGPVGVACLIGRKRRTALVEAHAARSGRSCPARRSASKV